MAQERRKGLPIPAKLVEFILLGPDRALQLQDSPILGDVWLAYGAEPALIQDLLITPYRDVSAGQVAKQIVQPVRQLRKEAGCQTPANVAYLQGIVAAQLYFDELLRVIVPMTRWWSGVQKTLDENVAFDPPQLRKLIEKILDSVLSGSVAGAAPGAQQHFTPLQRYVALAGILLWASEQKSPMRGKANVPSLEGTCKRIRADLKRVVDRLKDLFETIKRDSAKAAPGMKVFQVSLNRRAAPALERSVLAVKGDAARNLFHVSCKEIAWAVLDSGIQQNHPAFANQRVEASLDFTRVRDIISTETIKGARQQELLQGVRLDAAEVRQHLRQLQEATNEGAPLNWDLVEELITLDGTFASEQLTSHHGTHVAGIIGAAEVNGHAGGMCPDIKLYDFRVLGNTLEETEFAIIAALQYIRYLNDRYSYTKIHGANLSLSVPHNVRNYACGSTPICKECERLVESGVVVVAAAGNRGYQSFETTEGVFESYAAFSITDPGNADGVITVGATHANWPHTYGVSFFSSRGPTGDGRAKPDLVAPGERIEAPVPQGEWAQQSGTSMAAPHVSGAAAMLLARYAELVGQPRRIKQILCETATNLGRERSFQGHGMLDVLRALQSV